MVARILPGSLCGAQLTCIYSQLTCIYSRPLTTDHKNNGFQQKLMMQCMNMGLPYRSFCATAIQFPYVVHLWSEIFEVNYCWKGQK